MNREEFHTRFRGRMLLWLADAWAVRRCQPSELGSLMDVHAVQMKALLNEMYSALAGEEPAPVANGAARPQNGRGAG